MNKIKDTKNDNQDVIESMKKVNKSLLLKKFIINTQLGIMQKGMTFDHHFCYSFSFSFSLFFLRREEKSEKK